MKLSTFHKITLVVLAAIITSAVGYSGVSWCEHIEEQLGQHLVLDNPGDSPFAEHGNSDGKGCPGCVHLPAIDVADQSGVMSLAHIPAPSRWTVFEDPSSLQSYALSGVRSPADSIPVALSPPVDTQLQHIRTISLLI